MEKNRAYLRMTPDEREASDMAEFDEEGRTHRCAVHPSGVICRSMAEVDRPCLFGEASCADCRDVGYCRQQVPVEHKDFGKLYPCHCLLERRATYLISKLAGEEVGKAYTFESFQVRRNPTMERVYQQLRAYAERDPNTRPWQVLLGNPGCGKTHLAIAACRQFIQEGFGVAFYTAPGMFDAMRYALTQDHAANRAAGGPGAGFSYEDLKERLQEVYLLVIDDLGMQKNTDWTEERLEDLLVYRAQKAKRTIITMNVKEYEALRSDRIESRFHDAVLTSFWDCREALDLRPKRAEIETKPTNKKKGAGS